MASLLLKKGLAYLKQRHVVIQFPLNILLWGLEALAEINFSCPCNVDINQPFALTMLFGPFFFILAVMFFIFRPFEHGWFHCPKTANGVTKDEDKDKASDKEDKEAHQSCLKSFGNCLIPPVMWVIILFLDGDYIVCSWTDWNGRYVFDEELNRSWCKPTEGMRNETELRRLTNYSLHCSRCIGYGLIGILGIVLVISVGVYDCCITGKFEQCRSWILKKCGQTDSKQGGPHNSNDSKVSSMHGIQMKEISSARSNQSTNPSNISESVTGNKQDEGMTKPTGETQTESTETHELLSRAT